MMDHKLFFKAISISFISILLISTHTKISHAVEDLSNHMSAMDMGASGEIQKDRPRWEDVDIMLRKQMEKAYRSPTYNEIIFFAKYIELVPAEAILEFLEREESTCHRQAHELGRAVFRKHKNINQALKICSNGCTNACMHGAIGEAFSDEKHSENHTVSSSENHSDQNNHAIKLNQLIEKMEPFCREGEMALLHKRGNCAHAMGHALMLKTNHNIESSLSACGHFTEPGMDYYCATGVYMQYLDDAHLNKTRQIDVDRWGSNYPCNQHTAYPAACYRYIVNMVKNERDLGLEHLVILCSQLPGDAKAGCYHGLGTAYTPYLGSHPTLLKVVCSAGTHVDQALCIEGAIEKLADFNEQWALAACETLDGKNKSICLDAANEKMYRLDKTTIELYRTGIEVDDTATIEISDAEICIDGRK